MKGKARAQLYPTVVVCRVRENMDCRDLLETIEENKGEVLLREIHHRVKNNLQIISSLLQKQARLSGDDGAKQFAKDGQERIQSMALVHENLYKSDQLSGVNIKDYLVNLSANDQKGHDPVDTEVALDLTAKNEQLDLDTVIPVGLIFNELLTNAYKYAFTGKKEGKIKVDLKKEGTQYQFVISDDGVVTM